MSGLRMQITTQFLLFFQLISPRKERLMILERNREDAHLLSFTCIILKKTTTKKKQNLNSSITLILPAASAADGELCRGGSKLTLHRCNSARCLESPSSPLSIFNIKWSFDFPFFWSFDLRDCQKLRGTYRAVALWGSGVGSGWCVHKPEIWSNALLFGWEGGRGRGGAGGGMRLFLILLAFNWQREKKSEWERNWLAASATVWGRLRSAKETLTQMAPSITELEAAAILFSLLVFALFTLTGMLSENGNGLLTQTNFFNY